VTLARSPIVESLPEAPLPSFFPGTAYPKYTAIVLWHGVDGIYGERVTLGLPRPAKRGYVVKRT